MRLNLALAFFVFWGALTASAAGNMEELFQENFTKLYHARHCGENVKRLVAAARKEFGSVEHLRIVSMTNKGFTVFGMVNAEKARGIRADKPSEEEANWYYHAFVLDDQGLVYDFDFGIEPRVLPLADYLEEMYLQEPECAEKKFNGRFCAGRKNKLADYLMQSMDAEEYSKGVRDEEKITKVYMKEAFEDWRVLF